MNGQDAEDLFSSPGETDDTASPIPLLSDTVQDELEQPNLAEILCAVHMCTASVKTLKDQIGGLWKEVSFLGQDLQKIWERTTAVESRVSNIEDKLLPIARDAQAAHQLA